MKHLIKFKEFKKSQSETSNFNVPYAAVEPPPNDKIWNYMKREIDKAPMWGIDMKDQEDENQELGDRKA